MSVALWSQDVLLRPSVPEAHCLLSPTVLHPEPLRKMAALGLLRQIPDKLKSR